MNDWNLWLSSNETRTAVKILNKYINHLKDALTDGSHIQEKSIEKISLDYTFTLGQVEGVVSAIEMIKDISFLVENESIVEKESDRD